MTPITRAEIDNVRGVDSGGVIDTLTDRKFIKIVGRKETLGRPLLYGTTQEFLRHFGLSHLSELPVIEAAKDVLPNQQETVQELPFDSQENIDQPVTDNTNEQQPVMQENVPVEPASDTGSDNNTETNVANVETQNSVEEQNSTEK